MLTALDKVTSRRIWFVPNFSVWGTAGWGDVDYLVLERVGSVNSILYGTASIGQAAQEVSFADLSDHRGNQLPSSIDAARVLLRPRSADAVFVVGNESSTGFKVARDSASAGPVTVDLMIIELGS